MTAAQFGNSTPQAQMAAQLAGARLTSELRLASVHHALTLAGIRAERFDQDTDMQGVLKDAGLIHEFLKNGEA